MAIVEFVRNDKLFDLSFTITDASANPVNLSSITIAFKMWEEGSTTSKVSSTSVTVNSTTSGTCSYTVQTSDFDAVGLYNAELELRYDTGKIQTVKLDSIKIVEDLP